MSFLDSLKGGRRFGAVALAVIVGGALACKTPVEDMQFQVGDYIFDFLADQALAGGDPAGAEAITNLVLGAVDTTITNAFGRPTGDQLFFWNAGGAAFDFALLGRNSTNDGRLPAIADADASTDFCDYGSPFYWYETSGAWNPYCGFSNLDPSSDYTLMLVRYSLTVNAELDQAAIMAGDAITAADALAPLGGAPAGAPTTECNASTAYDVPPNANPLVLGYATTDPSGAVVFDCIPTSGLVSPPQWWEDVTDVSYADSTPTGPNDGVTGVDLAQNEYNYLVLIKGQGTLANPVPTGDIALRFQIANDITAANTAINNAQAPYPTEPVFAGPGVAVKAGELTMAWTNLARLDNAVYQVWVYNEETGDMKSPSGDWTATDAAGDPAGSATAVQSFNTQGDWDNVFVTSDGIGDYTHVFLSITAAPATAPTTVQPVWAQYTDMAGAPGDPFQWTLNLAAPMEFGTFGTGAPVVWTSQGNGEGGFWGTACNPDDQDHCTGPTDVLEVIFRNLQVPPVGYYYEAYLINDSGEPVTAGMLLSKATASTSSVSLFDIDTDETLQSEYTNGQDIIIWSQTNTTLEDLGGQSFYNMLEYRLQLIPKSGVDIGPTTALGGETPAVMRQRQPDPEPAE